MRTDQYAATLRSAAADVDTDVDLLFDSLTSPRRRFVLVRLQNASQALGLTELAEEIACWELDTPCADVSEDTLEAIVVSLHHVHLPKLTDAGLVAYDREHSTVDTTDGGEELASLECLPRVS